MRERRVTCCIDYTPGAYALSPELTLESVPEWLMGTFTVGCRSSRTQAFRGEAVAAATSEAARVCGLNHRKGLLRKGCDADLIVVDGDLQIHLTALHRVRLVVLAGKSVG